MNDIYEEAAVAEAAENGNVEAQLQYGKMLCGLADRFVDDVHVVRYCDETIDGIAWLTMAAESGNLEANELLKGIRTGEIHLPTRGEYYYAEGMRYIKGDGVVKDLEHAEMMLLDAAESGCIAAQREVAKLCLGLVDTAYEESLYGTDPKKWLEKAAGSGDGEAQHLLAVMECEGNLNEYPVDDEKFAAGLRWVRERADAGDAVAQCQFGRMLIFAWDFPDMTGLDYLKKSCQNGNAQAAFELGDLHTIDADWGDPDDPNHFEPDCEEGRRWYERAIELGSLGAADTLSDIIYLEERDDFDWDGGERHSEKLDKLFKYTKMAADGGCAYAKVRLAVLYAIGAGIAVDLDKALSLVMDTWISYPHLAAGKCIKMVCEQNMTIREALYECRNSIG